MADPMGNYPPLDGAEQQKLLADLSTHPTVEVLLMSLNGEYIGMTTFFVNYSTFRLKPYIYIHDVVVHKTLRNRYGQSMIKELVRLAQERDYCKLTLEVRNDNPAAQKCTAGWASKPAVPRCFFGPNGCNCIDKPEPVQGGWAFFKKNNLLLHNLFQGQ